MNESLECSLAEQKEREREGERERMEKRDRATHDLFGLCRPPARLSPPPRAS